VAAVNPGQQGPATVDPTASAEYQNAEKNFRINHETVGRVEAELKASIQKREDAFRKRVDEEYQGDWSDLFRWYALDTLNWSTSAAQEFSTHVTWSNPWHFLAVYEEAREYGSRPVEKNGAALSDEAAQGEFAMKAADLSYRELPPAAEEPTTKPVQTPKKSVDFGVRYLAVYSMALPVALKAGVPHTVAVQFAAAKADAFTKMPEKPKVEKKPDEPTEKVPTEKKPLERGKPKRP
jgi:hypothetical protein